MEVPRCLGAGGMVYVLLFSPFPHQPHPVALDLYSAQTTPVPRALVSRVGEQLGGRKPLAWEGREPRKCLPGKKGMSFFLPH